MHVTSTRHRCFCFAYYVLVRLFCSGFTSLSRYGQVNGSLSHPLLRSGLLGLLLLDGRSGDSRDTTLRVALCLLGKLLLGVLAQSLGSGVGRLGGGGVNDIGLALLVGDGGSGLGGLNGSLGFGLLGLLGGLDELGDFADINTRVSTRNLRYIPSWDILVVKVGTAVDVVIIGFRVKVRLVLIVRVLEVGLVDVVAHEVDGAEVSLAHSVDCFSLTCHQSLQTRRPRLGQR